MLRKKIIRILILIILLTFIFIAFEIKMQKSLRITYSNGKIEIPSDNLGMDIEFLGFENKKKIQANSKQLI